MKKFSKVFVALFAAGLSANLHAADTEELQWYLVEMAVFSRSSPYSLANEVWAEDPGTPESQSVIELIPNEGDARTHAGVSAGSGAREKALPDGGMEQTGAGNAFYPEAFQIVQTGNLVLTPHVNRLKRSRDYKVLLHTAWYQPAFESRHKRSVYLHDNLLTKIIVSEDPENAGPLNQTLFGTFRLGISRYLHAYFDLIYRMPREVTYHEEMDLMKDTVYLLPPDTEINYQTQPVTTVAMTGFRLKEARRIKSKQIHYFDHPAFGVLLYVTPFELPER